MLTCKGHAIYLWSIIAWIFHLPKVFFLYLFQPSKGWYSVCVCLCVRFQRDKHLSYRFCTEGESITFNQGQRYCFSLSAGALCHNRRIIFFSVRKSFQSNPADECVHTAWMACQHLRPALKVPGDEEALLLVVLTQTRMGSLINWVCAHTDE